MRHIFVTGLAIAAQAQPAAAHSFGTVYTLPVPVWMYVYGATAALALSFLMMAYFIATPAQATRNFATRDWHYSRQRWLTAGLQLLGVALLMLAISSGLIGANNSYLNFNMTFFWVVVLLGYTYWICLFGNSYPVLNPWQAIVDGIARLRPGSFDGCRGYPARLAYYPALVLYMALIWIELFGETKPRSLSLVLLAYTGINLAAAWWWGGRAWFHRGELFAVFFRVLGKAAPLHYTENGVRVRHPFIGLLAEPCRHPSLLLFILFMLSSTAYDGLLATELWRQYSLAFADRVMAVFGTDMYSSQTLFASAYSGFRYLGLLLSPFVYLAIYLLLIGAMRWLTGTAHSLRQLSLAFGYSLVPIAIVYNVSHYFTLALFEGPRIFRLLSDPFGFGWNLFGTRHWFDSAILVPADRVWQIQVALILIGHIISVYLMHLVALRLFASARQAVISQLPMLGLMMIYTASGLWILSLPIQS